MANIGSLFGDNKLISILLEFAVFVVVVVVVVAVVRRVLHGQRFNIQDGGRRQPRLSVIDVFDLDRQRQLVLVRRDNVEHLIMIGGPNDVLIEAAITRATAVQAAVLHAPPSAGLVAPQQAPAARTTMPILPPEPPRAPEQAPSPAPPPPAPAPSPAATPPAQAPSPAAAPPRPQPPSPPLPRPVPFPSRPAQPIRPTPAASPAPPGAAPKPTPAPGTAPPPPAAPPPPPTPVNPLDSLEAEMAKLLGRPAPPKT